MPLRIEIGACFKRIANGAIEHFIGELQDGGIDFIHLDISDERIFNEAAFSDVEIEEIRRKCKVTLEAHIAEISPRPMKCYKDLGIDRILIHQEAIGDKEEMLKEAKKLGLEVGIALKPTSKHDDPKVLYSGLTESVLVMCARDSLGRKIYDPHSSIRVREVRNIFDGHINTNSGVFPVVNQRLEDSTVFQLAASGATRFSIERGMFHSKLPVQKVIEKSREAARAGKLASECRYAHYLEQPFNFTLERENQKKLSESSARTETL